MSEPPEELLTVAEVAAILKLNQQTVRNWIDSGFLPAIRIGAPGPDQAFRPRRAVGGDLHGRERLRRGDLGMRGPGAGRAGVNICSGCRLPPHRHRAPSRPALGRPRHRAPARHARRYRPVRGLGREHWPPPRRTVEIDPWQLAPGVLGRAKPTGWKGRPSASAKPRAGVAVRPRKIR